MMNKLKHFMMFSIMLALLLQKVWMLEKLEQSPHEKTRKLKMDVTLWSSLTHHVLEKMG